MVGLALMYLDMHVVLYIICFVFLLYVLTKFWVQSFTRNLPPGPKGLPLVGYLSPLSHTSLYDHRDIYGDISCIRALGTNIVVLNSLEVIRDAFQSPDVGDTFNSRIKSFFTYLLHDDIISKSPDDPFWKQKRQVLHRVLRVYGEGIPEVERVVTDELEHVISLLKEITQREFDLNDYLGASVLNILYTLLTGERYDYTDDKIKNVMKGNEIANNLSNPFADLMMRVFPFLKYIPLGVGKSCQLMSKAGDLYLETVYENCRILNKKQRENRKGVSFELLKHEESMQWFTSDMSRGCLQNIGAAGNLTTWNSLYTFFLILLHYQEVQDGIQREIDSYIGNRKPTSSDRHSMPYTRACIYELFRYGSNVPLSVHQCSKTTEFKGYTIPKGCIILANVFRVHHDNALWKDPWEYDPTRFIDADGSFVPSTSLCRQNLIPFGLGRRMCVGENFAKTRIFIYITTLLQTFSFKAVGQLPPCDPRTYSADTVIHPPSFRMYAVPRQMS